MKFGRRMRTAASARIRVGCERHEQSTLSGAQIKALVGKDSSYQLFQELEGNDPDKIIGDTEAVTIRNGLHFYTVPPATLGGRWM